MNMFDSGKYKKYVGIAKAFAELSEYKGTHVGAIVLGPGMEVRSSGWNGAPRGSKADSDQRSEERSERLRWTVHAEANAIANAARAGTSLAGGTLVCTHPPCLSCARLIVQAGIKVVLYSPPEPGFEGTWQASLADAETLFNECGVAYVQLPRD